MSVVEFNCKFLIIDKERVMIMPEKGTAYELPKRETEYVLRIFGTYPEKRITEIPPVLKNSQIMVLSVLGKNSDPMTVRAIAELLHSNPSTVAGRLYKLERLELAQRTVSSAAMEHLWQITTNGTATLAEHPDDA